MRKLKYNLAQPITSDDFLEIEMNWFDVELPSFFWGLGNKYDKFCEWAHQNCEGCWYWFHHYKNKNVDFGGNRICFLDPADRIKFILGFM